MKTIGTVIALGMICLSGLAQAHEISWDQFRDSLHALKQDSMYAMAREYLTANRESFKDEWFKLSKEEIFLNEKLGMPEANLDIFREAHDRGYFYLIHPELPKYRVYTDLPGFPEISDTDLKLREAANADSRMLWDIVTPVNFDERRKYPVILLFHGGGSNLERVKKHWNNTQLKEQFIRIYVQNYLHYDSETFGWRSGDEQAFQKLQFLFAAFLENFRLEEPELYLAGMSAGGTFAIDAAVRQILPVSAFITFCPGIPGILGSEHHHEIQATDVRGFMLGGEQDYYLERQKQMMHVFREKGIECHHEIIQDMGHAYPKDEQRWIDEALKKLRH